MNLPEWNLRVVNIDYNKLIAAPCQLTDSDKINGMKEIYFLYPVPTHFTNGIAADMKEGKNSIARLIIFEKTSILAINQITLIVKIEWQQD